MKNKKTLAVILSMSLVFSSAVSSAGAETDYDNSDISTFEMDDESDLIYDSDEISPGDINADGKVDLTDLTELSLALIGDKELTENQQKAADVDDDGAVKLSDLARMRQYLSKVITSLSTGIVHDPSVDSFIPVAELLFSELDKGTLKVRDTISDQDFMNLAGEDSDVYKNSYVRYNPDTDLEAYEYYNIPSLLKIVSKDDPFYEYLQDTEKLESLSFDEINEMLNNTFPDDSDIDPEDIYSPAGMELLHALFDSYEFLEAYILDNDTIIINNGTGFLLSVEGIVVTRNGKTYENEELTDSELFSFYDGEQIYITGKAEGYDNVYRWYAGT